jgi:hypothetical protein
MSLHHQIKKPYIKNKNNSIWIELVTLLYLNILNTQSIKIKHIC